VRQDLARSSAPFFCTASVVSMESSLPQTWDPTIAEAHVKHNISNHDCMWAAIADYGLPFAEGKAVADLGAGDGTLGKLLQAQKMSNVDPFPPENCSELIVKADGVDFLGAQPDQSLDLVISTFAVHFMDRERLDQELARVLTPTGRAIWFSFSKSSMLFGNEDFNDTYYSVGFGEDGSGTAGSSSPTEVVKIQRPSTYWDLRNHIQHRCHSNLKQMDDDTLARLIALIPSDLTTLDIRLDVFEFVPSPTRDSMVQLQR